ncbi:MAG: exodeoxyribonuclease VII large subunit [Muribaculaceae bacterium]|nr:exodeoxyribonuclease VII large subunit [Muribaculaceae bacterium]
MTDSLFLQENFITGIPLSRLTSFITRAVTTTPELASTWVTAELSDVRIAGGHCYMELIEKNETGQTIAKLRATIWQSTFVRLRQKFYNAVGHDITTGIKVLIRGSVSHHSVFGLSFNITDIDPSYTMGDLERLRREIYIRLKKEGVVILNREKHLCEAPQRIAVISAEGAAGYGDFMNHLMNNNEGFVFYPFLFPCSMQGDRISSSIRGALQLIESTIDLWDCVVIIRGGGSTTDLNGFDDYELARAVATFPLPVIVGIGHERDRNILDEIAHTSLKTPTAVAGFFIDRLRISYDNILAKAEKVRQFANDIITGEQQRLATISGSLPLLVENRIVKNHTKLTGIAELISSLAKGVISRNNQKVNDLLDRMINVKNILIVNENKKINSLETLCSVLDPHNTLKRGYSITRIDGKAVTDSSLIKKGMKLSTTLNKGEIVSEVI